MAFVLFIEVYIMGYKIHGLAIKFFSELKNHRKLFSNNIMRNVASNFNELLRCWSFKILFTLLLLN